MEELKLSIREREAVQIAVLSMLDRGTLTGTVKDSLRSAAEKLHNSLCDCGDLGDRFEDKESK